MEFMNLFKQIELKAMKDEKFRVFCFLTWYLLFFISATSDKYFDLPSCMMINWLRMTNPTLVAFLLVLIPAVYFGSFASRLLHVVAHVLLCADGAFGLMMLSNRYIYYQGWEDIEGFRAYFWKPLFDAIGLSLKEDSLFMWGKYAGRFFPIIFCLINIDFLRANIVKKSSTSRESSALGKYKITISMIMSYLLTFAILSAAGINDDKYNDNRHAEHFEEFRFHLEAAVKGNVYSFASVGFHYWYGVGTEYNTQEALRWLEVSAHNGSTDAMALLGKAYYAGYRTGRDWDKARYWLTAAINNAQKKNIRGICWFFSREPNSENGAYERDVLDRIDKGLPPFSVKADSLKKK